MQNLKEEGNKILDDVVKSRESGGEGQTEIPTIENNPEVDNKSKQEVAVIEQPKEQIGQPAAIDQKPLASQPSKEAQLPPIPPAGAEEIQLPEAEIARSDERLLPVTPVDELAKTVKTLEGVPDKQEDAVDRAREIEQGNELKEIVGEKDKEETSDT